MKSRLLAVGFDYALRAVFGAVLALPLVAAVTSTGITNFPAGDRLLFEPGGLLLAEVTRALWAELVPLASTGLLTAFFMAVALLLPYGLVLAAFGQERPRSLSELWGRACTRLPTLLSLKGLVFAAQALALFVTATFAATLRAAAAGDTSRRADLTGLAVGAGGLLVVLALGLLRDLASAAAVEGGLGSRAASIVGFHALLRAPRTAVAAATLAGAGSFAAVALAALVSGALDVARAGTFRLVLVLVAHQGALLAMAACRAWWLGRALAVVAAQLAASTARR
jgi:hypothetical protein